MKQLVDKIQSYFKQIEQQEDVQLSFIEDFSLTQPSFRCHLTDSRLEQIEVVVKIWGNLRKHALFAWIHDKLLNAQYPTPETLYFGKLLIEDKVHGYTITRYVPYVQGEEVIELWAEAQQIEAYRTAGEWLRKLHQLFTFSKSGLLMPHSDDDWQPTEDWKEFLKADIERWPEVVNQSSIPQEEKDLFYQQYESYHRLLVLEEIDLDAPESYVLCHRDYHARNWLVDAQKKSLACIIDFDHMFAADPIFDFQRVHTYCLLQNKVELWDAFCLGYGVVPADIEQRSSLYVLNYGLGSAGYALRVQDSQFYRQALELLQKI